jgi:uncharacterized protein YaiI (UPF0178 family)
MHDTVADTAAKPPLRIWVDADACPVPVKAMLFRAARRTGVEVVLVANQLLAVPPSPTVRMVRVARGVDGADEYIKTHVGAGELVVTSDIPLAAAVVARGATGLSPRGEAYTPDNVQGLLDLRNFMDTLRGAGVQTGGPSAFSQADRQTFARELECWLRQRG